MTDNLEQLVADVYILALYGFLRDSTSVDYERSRNPRVGDTVIEMSKIRPDATMIGTLNSIETGNDGSFVYHVTALSGEKQVWSNAECRTIKRGV